MAGKRPSSAGRNTSALSRAPSRIGTSTSFSTTMPEARIAGAVSMFMRIVRAAGLFGSIVRQLDLHVGRDFSPIGEFRRVPRLRILQRGVGHRLDHLLL